MRTKWNNLFSRSVGSDCFWPHGLAGCSVLGISQARILEWVAMSSFRGSSQPRDQTQVSHLAGGFFTIWVSREATYIDRKQTEWGKEWELFFLLLPSENVTQAHLTLCDPMVCSFYPCNSLGKNTGEDCLSLLQELFPTQGRTWVSHIADRFFTVWATRKVLRQIDRYIKLPVIIYIIIKLIFSTALCSNFYNIHLEDKGA